MKLPSRAGLPGLLLALTAALPCWAQVNHGATNEWSSFLPPVAEPDRTGPVHDLAFQALKQGGPWRPEPAAGEVGDAQRLLALIRQANWADALAWLKQANPDPNAHDERGATPLSLAAAAGRTDLVKELLRQGAEPDQRGAGGMTPLGVASFNGHELVVRELLRRGARTDVPNATGQWPLHLACATGQQGVVKLLLDAGSDATAPNREGRHAFAEAAYFGQLGVMQQLLDMRRVRADLPDFYGRNALHAAALGQQSDAVAWLAQRGVVPNQVLTQVLLDQADQWAQGALVSP